jgi:antitoxin (DNA-binding transcriptional repressor) of toxin-antitoxin stability system
MSVETFTCTDLHGAGLRRAWALVEAGQVVVVTRCGRPFARILPVVGDVEHAAPRATEPVMDVARESDQRLPADQAATPSGQEIDILARYLRQNMGLR